MNESDALLIQENLARFTVDKLDERKAAREEVLLAAWEGLLERVRTGRGTVDTADAMDAIFNEMRGR